MSGRGDEVMRVKAPRTPWQKQQAAKEAAAASPFGQLVEGWRAEDAEADAARRRIELLHAGLQENMSANGVKVFGIEVPIPKRPSGRYAIVVSSNVVRRQDGPGIGKPKRPPVEVTFRDKVNPDGEWFPAQPLLETTPDPERTYVLEALEGLLNGAVKPKAFTVIEVAS